MRLRIVLVFVVVGMLFSFPVFAWGAFLNGSQKLQLSAYNISKETLFFEIPSGQKVKPILDTDIPYAFTGNSSGIVGRIYENETRGAVSPDIKMKLNYRVEPTNPNIRKLALAIASDYPGAYNIGQVCAIFSHLNDGWSYVSDPRGENYYSYASESLDACKNASCIGAGDCDDFAILMSAFIESIGGTTRYIIAENKSGKSHAYVEVYLGKLDDKKNQIEDVTHWVMEKYGADIIYAHIDMNTEEVWLNLDWSATHPGGSFYPGDKYYVFYIRDNLTRTSPEARKQSHVFKPLSYEEIWNKIGIALSNQSKFEKAIQCFDKAIGYNATYAAAWCNKGNALDGLRKYDEAIKAYDEAIRLDPNLDLARLNREHAQNELSHDIEAKKRDDEISPSNYIRSLIIKQNASIPHPTPNNQGVRFSSADFWYDRGSVLFAQGNYEAAIQCFDNTIAIDPNYAIAWNDRGVAYAELGNYNEALKCFNKALEIKPAAAIWSNKGLTLMKLYRYSEANVAFAKARELDTKGHSSMGYNPYQAPTLLDILQKGYITKKSFSLQSVQG